MTRWLSLSLVVSLCLAGQAWGFSYRGQDNGENTGPTDSGEAIVWYQHQVVMGLNFGDKWNDQARLALQQWNEAGANFQFHDSSVSATTCVNDGINSTGWSDTNCGADWGNIIASTRVNMTKIGGTWYITDTDVTFNSKLKFDTYAGPLRQDTDGKHVYDFIRVALHEFGHAAGLLHPNESGQSVAAIMNTGSSSLVLDHLQDDDIAGIRHLYAGDQNSTDDIIIEGYQSYSIANDHINLVLNAINSFRNSTSKPLTLEVRANASTENAHYYLLGSIPINPLGANERRGLGDLNTDYTPPPAGLHSVSLALLEEGNATPLYTRAIGYMEVSSDSQHTGTDRATDTVNSSSGGGGTIGLLGMLGLAALMWRQRYRADT
jgi:hypothetical protein